MGFNSGFKGLKHFRKTKPMADISDEMNSKSRSKIPHSMGELSSTNGSYIMQCKGRFH